MKIKVLLFLFIGASFIYACKKSSDSNSTPTDTTAPVITLNGSASVSIAHGGAYTDAGATATDDVDGTVSVSSNASATNPNVNTDGVYTITYTASDKAGNVATKYRVVSVGFTRNDYLWTYSTTSAPYGYSAHDSDLVSHVASNYTGCSITAGTGPNDIKIGCFLYTLTNCTATVNGAVITLTSPQTFSGSGTISNGTGTLNSAKNKMTIVYHNDTENHNHIVVLTK